MRYIQSPREVNQLLGIFFRILCRRSIGPGTSIDWLAKIRPPVKIGARCKIGRCEIKNAVIGDDCRIPHECLIGDATLEEGVNFSAGARTANWDGIDHHHTIVRKNALIGVNVTLIAPIEIPEETYIGAGSVVTRKTFKGVPPHTLVVAYRTTVDKRPGISWKIGDSWLYRFKTEPDPALMEEIRRTLNQGFSGNDRAISRWLTSYGANGMRIADIICLDPPRALSIIQRYFKIRDLE